MNWIVMLIAFYLILALERGLGTLIAVPIPRLGELQPSLAVIIVSFIAFRAPKKIALIASYLMGLTLDLMSVFPLAGSDQYMLLVGPHALGFLLGAVCLYKIRDTLRPKHPLSLALATFMMLCSCIVMGIILVGLRYVIGWGMGLINTEWYPAMVGIGWRYWILELLAAVISAVIASIFAFPLYKLGPLFGFETRGRSSY